MRFATRAFIIFTLILFRFLVVITIYLVSFSMFSSFAYFCFGIRRCLKYVCVCVCARACLCACVLLVWATFQSGKLCAFVRISVEDEHASASYCLLLEKTALSFIVVFPFKIFDCHPLIHWAL